MVPMVSALERFHCTSIEISSYCPIHEILWGKCLLFVPHEKWKSGRPTDPADRPTPPLPDRPTEPTANPRPNFSDSAASFPIYGRRRLSRFSGSFHSLSKTTFLAAFFGRSQRKLFQRLISFVSKISLFAAYFIYFDTYFFRGLYHRLISVL